MTFEELLPLLQQHKYAIRPGANYYIFMVPNNSFFWIMFFDEPDAKPLQCIFTIEDFVATDWQIIGSQEKA